MWGGALGIPVHGKGLQESSISSGKDTEIKLPGHLFALFFYNFQVPVLETSLLLTYFMIVCQTLQFLVPI